MKHLIAFLVLPFVFGYILYVTFPSYTNVKKGVCFTDGSGRCEYKVIDINGSMVMTSTMCNGDDAATNEMHPIYYLDNHLNKLDHCMRVHE